MLTTFPCSTQYTVRQSRQHPGASDISRLLSAAVINKNFRNLLLSDPARALREGFSGEQFHLEEADRALILSIQAQNLKEFATQLTARKDTKPSYSNEYWIPVEKPSVALNAD